MGSSTTAYINGVLANSIGSYPIAVEKVHGGFSTVERRVYSNPNGEYVRVNNLWRRVLTCWGYQRVNGADEMLYGVYSEDVFVLFRNPSEHLHDSKINEQAYTAAINGEMGQELAQDLVVKAHDHVDDKSLPWLIIGLECGDFKRMGRAITLNEARLAKRGMLNRGVTDIHIQNTRSGKVYR